MVLMSRRPDIELRIISPVDMVKVLKGRIRNLKLRCFRDRIQKNYSTSHLSFSFGVFLLLELLF